MITTNKSKRIKDLEEENQRLLDRCAILELDLRERIEALEVGTTANKTVHTYREDHYQ